MGHPAFVESARVHLLAYLVFASKFAPHDTTTNLNEISTARECHFIRNSLKASRAAQDDKLISGLRYPRSESPDLGHPAFVEH